MFQFLGQKAKFPVSEVDSPTTLAPPASGVAHLEDLYFLP